jgi:HSP20 family protein
MQIIRRPQQSWDPFREMEDIANRFSRLFGLTKVGNGERETLSTADWYPSCDISESEKEYRIAAELPSVKKEDVHVTLEQGLLTIQGERKEQREEKGLKYHRRELSYGKFVRRFTMPDDADESRVEATFDNGVLNVVIGRSKAKQSKAREIAVH